MLGVNKYAVSLLLGTVAISCSEAERPQLGGTLRLPGGSVTGLDPKLDSEFTASVFVMDRIYSNLYKSEGDPGNVADSISSDSAGGVWRIHLKKNLYFQDDPCFPGGEGEEITAEDVRFSYMRAKQLPHVVLPIDKQVNNVEVLDRYLLKITLNEPNLRFLEELGREEYVIVSKIAVQYYGDDFRFHPVGSGPFRLAELDLEQVTLVKNENYWVTDEYGQKLPYLDKIVFTYDPDPVSRYRKLLSGEFDVISLSQINSPSIVKYDVESHSFALIDTLRESGYKLVEGRIFNLLHLKIESQLQPEPYVEKALNMAIDRERIQRNGMCTIGIPARGPLYYPLSLEAEEHGYNPEMARTLLAQGGYPDGAGFPTVVIRTSTAAVPVAQEVIKDFKSIGIEAEYTVAPQLSNPMERKGSYIFLQMLNYTAWEDPLDQLMPYHGKYYLTLNNSVFDSLYYLAEKEPSEIKRLGLVRRMERIVLDKPPLVFLFWTRYIYIAKGYVINLSPERFGVHGGTWIKK